MRILGIDPGLQKTGWGILDTNGNALSFVACGLIKTQAGEALAKRLCILEEGLADVIKLHQPDEAAVEETFVNKNPASALKLGIARGIGLLVPAKCGLKVGEYPANLIKKTIVGSGHASKDQIGMMVRTLLPAAPKMGADEADALAIAITHHHHAKARILEAS